jgi:hypothetical protein
MKNPGSILLRALGQHNPMHTPSMVDPGLSSDREVCTVQHAGPGAENVVNVPWAVVGGVRFAGPFGNPGNKSPLDDYTEVFSHELVESISDPFLDGVRLLPQVQAARSIADDSNELGDFAQSFDPAPYRRMSNGLSVSAYWSDWHGTGIVPERYPDRDEYSAGKPCPPIELVHRYLTEIQRYLDTHGGDPSPILNALRR